jgi:hypothetical protein
MLDECSEYTCMLTLGVYITPNGSSAGAFTVLKDTALTYATVITGTHIT